MKNIAYILIYMGNPVAAIIAQNETEVEPKLKDAIQEEVGAEKDAQFSLNIPRMGDWGEQVSINTSYVQEGTLIEDNEFKLMKTVTY